MKLLTCLLLLCVTPVCLAVEVQQGKQYAGGAYVESSQAGIGLSVPMGWKGTWPTGTEVFMLESRALKATVFMTFEQLDDAGIRALMSNPVPLDTMTRLVPKSPVRMTGKVYTAQYTVDGAPELSAYITARAIRPALAVAFIAMSADASTVTEVERIALKLATNLKVNTPATPPATTKAPTQNGGDLWSDYFKGRYIAHYFSGSGYTEEQHLWLCSDGRFLYKSASGGYSPSGASGAYDSRGKGYWTATGSTNGEGQLILQFGAGSVSETHTPDTDTSSTGEGGERWVYHVLLEKKLYLDGKQWLRGRNGICD